MRNALPLIALLAGAPALAQQVPPTPVAGNSDSRVETRAGDAAQVLNGTAPADRFFSPGFLKQVPAEKLAEIGNSLSAQFGPITGIGDFTRVGAHSAKFNFLYRNARAAARIQIDPDSGLITGMLITDVTPLGDSFAAIDADAGKLHGKVGYAIYRLGTGAPRLVHGRSADQQFAIGSAFKLWVLDALAEDIAKGKRKWSDVVPLSVRSFPSGVMQDWPQGAPVTLATLATQMISISDNTATDMLIKVLGRDAIAARVRATGHSDPSRMIPVLSTLEAFSFKLGPDAPRDAYAAASDLQQKAMLARLSPGFAVEKIDLGKLTPGRIWHIDQIEWFASPRDIAGVLQSLQRRKDPQVMRILSVNPGTTRDVAAQFNRFGFKGGSEEGVLNLSWVVQNTKGEWFVVTASWNDAEQPVDLSQFLALSRRLLERIK